MVGLRTDIRRSGDDPTTSVNLMLSQSWKEFLDAPLDKGNIHGLGSSENGGEDK